ncbi:DUF445 family protein [Pikeienuella piscinae]|uniref:DUF445 family protein n=1 Tax=Pikeienuella piscinae TaxID=2748098 RepID=A0A7L5BZA1_9RHOB|nr:DUF445 family protein [Pikeienuella piscinae]QIE56158.1 DUF445 family protein [Pikeienuella piscinae]
MVTRLGTDERRKLEELRKVKRLATLALAFCLALLVAAKLLTPFSPAFVYLAAFAEAAAIGGIADWYAIVAIFRRPLGLPIPHTAIIPRNQDRIGDNLGAFIERNFLAPEPVVRKLREVDFAEEMIRWLGARDRSEGLARFVARLAPQMMAAMEETGLKEFAAERVMRQLRDADIAPLVVELMDGMARDGRHQKLLDEVISALHRFLNDKDAIEAIRKKVAEELPTVLNFFRADTIILRRILRTASALMEDVRKDPEHELRAEFEQFFRAYLRRLKRSPQFRARIEAAKAQILSRPELGAVADQMWASLRTYVQEDATAETSVLAERLTGLFMDIARNLETEPKLRADINEGVVTAVSAFIAEQKQAVSGFVADQVKGWDFAQLTLLIEANIGRDLQYIRFNGMLIGGLAGLCLHVLLADILGV